MVAILGVGLVAAAFESAVVKGLSVGIEPHVIKRKISELDSAVVSRCSVVRRKVSTSLGDLPSPRV